MWDKEIQDASPEIYDREWAKMATGGVETTRVIFSWNLAQEQQGQTTFKYTDPMVAAAANHGIEALELAQAPGTAQACRARAEDFSRARCTNRYLELYASLA